MLDILIIFDIPPQAELFVKLYKQDIINEKIRSKVIIV